MPPLLKINNLTIKDEDRSILHNLTFSIEKGERVVLIGPSGAGKTSILLSILGYHTPAEGSITFNGEFVGGKGIALIRSQISYISQEPITGAPTFGESILLPFSFKQNKKNTPNRETIEKVLKKLNFDFSVMQQPSSKLSGGEKQRMAIARTLLLGKKFFLLDEITSALDEKNKEIVMELLTIEENTILSVSHDKDWIKRCTRTIEIQEGTVFSDSQRSSHEDH